jgi:hypothetical protein
MRWLWSRSVCCGPLARGLGALQPPQVRWWRGLEMEGVVPPPRFPSTGINYRQWVLGPGRCPNHSTRGTLMQRTPWRLWERLVR